MALRANVWQKASPAFGGDLDALIALSHSHITGGAVRGSVGASGALAAPRSPGAGAHREGEASSHRPTSRPSVIPAPRAEAADSSGHA